jgi:hypothetical protein
MALLNDSTIFRNENLKRKQYGKNNEYSSSHPNALSDGDEFGKGERNGQIGGATDIVMRAKLLKFNKYGKDNAYESVTEQPLT